MVQLIKNVRVLDLAGSLVPIAGQMLAKLGADVIKVEPPAASTDVVAPMRRVAFDAGKRSVTCNIETAAGRELLTALARDADVLIVSEDPQYEEARRLAPTLREINPRLINVSITAFGEDGPKSSYATSDLILWAAGGALWPNRDGDKAPLRISSEQTFHHAGADAAIGALMALTARHQTGRGQDVRVAAVESVSLATLATVLATAVGHKNYTVTAPTIKPKESGKKDLDLSGSGSRTPRTKMDAKDGKVELHLALGPAAGRFTNKLFAWLKSIGASGPPFTDWDWANTLPQMILNGEVTEADLDMAREQVNKAISKFTKVEILELAVRNKIVMAPILTIEDLVETEHLKVRGAFTDVKDRSGRGWRIPSALTGLPGTDQPLRGAPEPGEQNAEIYAEIGVNKERLAALSKEGIV